jgi:hypothetical protein
MTALHLQDPTTARSVVSETMQFTIGSDVSCRDGSCGELRRVVVDPIALALTHLVVEEKHRQGLGHLVPIDLVTSSGAEIHLGCTRAQFEALEDAKETQFLPQGHRQCPKSMKKAGGLLPSVETVRVLRKGAMFVEL